MLPVRVFFVKKGSSVYISHLDVQRAVVRALQRTGYGLAFTEGFNPHLKLVFAMPLSLFQESDYEIFDFTVLDDGVSYKEVLDKLKSVFPEEMTPFAAEAPVSKLSSLASASYTIYAETRLDASKITLADVMTVSKKSKKGMTEVDIRPLIRSFTAQNSEKGVILDVVCDCGSNSHLNVQLICDWFGFLTENCRIVRTGLYCENGQLLK